ncbi:MAG: response regulator [Candidatus Adiutrix sp.]|jgi:signal transduction histidine kinase/DNA-binding NarL/FixJ family response regulator/HPt (histidine-containing phosphotransfer) domain-containing protein|nr:response regulator [Candidatus Adiutrix sp.]
MSIRVRVLLIIVAIVAFISATTLGVSIFFIRRGLEQTVESDITVMSEIADKLVSGAINLLKARAATSAQHLLNAPESEWPRIFQEQIETDEQFMAMTVFDSEGIVDSYGRAPTPVELMKWEYIRKAFAGEMVISTTRKDPSGEVVFHVCVPMEGRVLSVTIPGLYFRDLLAPYKIWNTGTVFILDKDGAIIAHERTSLVTERHNFIETARTNPGDHSAAEFSRLMTRGRKGVGRYSFFGVERIAVFAPITGSAAGWTLGVSAPLAESPAAHVDKALMLAALAFLGMGSLAAFFASGVIAKPFQTIKEQNAYLAQLNETAKNASEAKSRFLANMSHEMRTPLNAVIGFSELMLHGRAAPEESGAHLGRIHTAGLTLLGLVNDILDISKIEAGKFELVLVDYDLASLINDTVAMNIMRIGGKPVEFRLNVEESLPSRMIGDEVRLKQICSNLLSNAFKYTRSGEVEMSVSGEREADGLWLTVSVRDTGIGIRPEDMPRLFSNYSQLDAKSNRRIEGAGLGLAIAGRLAEMMGGKISVESEYGRGSLFTARVRQQAASERPLGAAVAENLRNFNYGGTTAPHKAQIEVQPLPYARVLVVDDVATNLEVARGMLKPYGLRVDCVTGGRQAVDLVRKGAPRYDAIFMDHMMPGLDGIEAARLIREEVGTDYARHVPIIALTANAIVGNERIFLRHGFQAFISKPIDAAQLDLALNQWVRDDGKGAEAARGGPATAAPEETAAPEALIMETAWRIDGLDLAEGLERFGGDGEALLRTLRSYAANTPALLDQVREPAEADLSAYGIVIHGLKSSSYGICARRLGKSAEELERAAQSGDFNFIRANNGAFVAAAEELIAGLAARLENLDAENQKPGRAAPDADVLDRLREACANYDMDGVDRAMVELERYAYEDRADLAAWLRERVDVMDFKEILARLSE